MILALTFFFYTMGSILIWQEILDYPSFASSRAIRKFPYKREKGGG